MDTIVIGGGSGIIGSQVVEISKHQGYRPLVLTRDKSRADQSESYLHWDISEGYIDPQIKEANHIINLAGSGIADGRWTKKRKKEILDSRMDSTQLLINTIRDQKLDIKSFISASAIGFYGDGGDVQLDEEDPIQTKEFLSDVCVAWEAAAAPAAKSVDHLCIVRIGTVLSPSGGALEKMTQTIPLGIASYLGSGKQYMSWIHLEDIARILVYSISNQLSGIYNAVAPEVLSNKEFTDKLRQAINPKALLLPAPALGIKVAFGEMSRVVLNSSNISAEKIENTGFKFSYPTLNLALQELYSQESESD